LGMNIILSSSVQFSSHSETSITPFSIPEPLQCDPSLPMGQKDRMIVYKFISDCLDMINA